MSSLEQSTSRLTLAVEKLHKVAERLGSRDAVDNADTSALRHQITLLSAEKESLDQQLTQVKSHNRDAREQLERAIARLETLLK